MSPKRADLEKRPHYLYRHYDAAGQLLYIGLTTCPETRPWVKADRPWLPQSVRCEISDPINNRTEAIVAEMNAIRDEWPLHNWPNRYRTYPVRPPAPAAPDFYSAGPAIAELVENLFRRANGGRAAS